MPKVVKKLKKQKGVNSYSDENKSDSNVDIRNAYKFQDSKTSKTTYSSMSKMEKASANPTTCIKHVFDASEIVNFRIQLMEWYDREQRVLPWRNTAKTEAHLNKRIYSVWVSEVMLQQTQVATVLPYYQAWLAAWPTVESLASAQLHDVHKCWAGLGYYSRATRLHQSAQKVCSTLGGQLPTTSAALQSQLSGVGRYTAAAVASIACGEAVAVVDGNVARVLARMRAVGADVTDKRTAAALWGLAEDLLDPQRPGDANQALMELGATVCTPKKPQCSSCPVRSCCAAYKEVLAAASAQPPASVLDYFTSSTAADRGSGAPSGGGGAGQAETPGVPGCRSAGAALRTMDCSENISSPTESSRQKSMFCGPTLSNNKASAMESDLGTKKRSKSRNLEIGSHENKSMELEMKFSPETDSESKKVKEEKEGGSASGLSPPPKSTDLPSLGDLEDACWLCLPSPLRDPRLGVQNYPRKGSRASSRRQTCAVVVLRCTGGGQESSGGPAAPPRKRQRTGGSAAPPHAAPLLLALQRPPSGLLASLWDLPSIEVTSDEELRPERLRGRLHELYSLPPARVSRLHFVDDVVHIFSHIHQTYKVYVGTLAGCPPLPVPATHQAVAYMTARQFQTGAVSTAMKKVLKKAISHWEKPETEARVEVARNMKQTTISQFLSR